ncbi:hypothetical protein PFISCL1PPCAC_17309, partial [Pristionchus fissidentatus]
SSSKPLIKFFFDINSPYSYVGFEILARLHANRSSDLAVQWMPVRVPAIFKKLRASSGPVTITPEKTAYTVRDLCRQAEYYGVDIKVPQNVNLGAFLRSGNTVAAQRLIIAADAEKTMPLTSLIRAFFARMWRDHLPMHEQEHLEEILSSLNIDRATSTDLISKITSPEVKQKFVDNTQEAIDDGAIGVPWMKVYRAGETNHESYFGSDRFHLIEKYLRL